MATLEEHGDLSQADIGRHLGLDRNDVNGILNRLEGADRIHRRPDPPTDAATSSPSPPWADSTSKNSSATATPSRRSSWPGSTVPSSGSSSPC
ncbi:MarR family transcriptional regulator [Streptomyces sp. NPDC002573]|uniref:MarR family transcriptional regulator n=1 Tax=Streptomyces sp. NPDC002573 TaxID=3364651 RepID=UPI00367FAB0C